MTDGIIQEVFNSMKKPMCDCAYCNEIESKKQELIEKIKQRFPIDYDDYYEYYSMWHEAIQKILIGDNQ